ncbi:RadC family protein [Palleronia sp. LCG004]|uniref:RadC family protein n=1 Tax=Palleronia sp. LCG004 TaxID=3079304 RepID=UPI002941BB85|nr:DNA repair protein RadC [Palleronia sp. LCG004]WOI58359.1 DNA repair protein RadC [Palleronia sp. LCG004]
MAKDPAGPTLRARIGAWIAGEPARGRPARKPGRQGAIARPAAPRHGGFSDDYERGLRDLEARSVPPGVETEPAFSPRYERNARLSEEASAGGGLVRQPDGSLRPHYWGHRERLRQRFLKGGHEAMPDYELLELMLFDAIPRIDVKPLAKRLLAAFGDLNGVVAASEASLMRVEGATPKVHLQLRLAEAFAHRMGRSRIMNRQVLASWGDVVAHCRTTMAHRNIELFRVLFMDHKNTLIAEEELGEGTIDHVPVYPREVARRALELNSNAIILVHNHPSGDPSPSRGDVEMTERVIRACAALEITVHDHIIVGHEEVVSLRAEGLIAPEPAIA